MVSLRGLQQVRGLHIWGLCYPLESCQEPDASYTGGEHQRVVSLELSLFSLPFPGTVPLSVWKLPLVTKVDLSGNLLTRLTGETAHKVMESSLVVPWSWVGRGGLLKMGVCSVGGK